MTISSYDDISDEYETNIDDKLLPQFRALKFKDKKPVVLITARVHPGGNIITLIIKKHLPRMC